MHKSILFLAACALAASGAAAQQPQTLPDIMMPGAGHRRIEHLAGDWDVAVKFRYGAGPERASRARAHSEWTLGGRVLRQDYTAESGQITLQLIGFDNQRGKYYQIKFDNFDTGVLHTEGVSSSDGKTITMTGDRVDPMSGKVAQVRIVMTLTDADHYAVEWFQGQPDGTDQRTVLMEHSRHR